MIGIQNTLSPAQINLVFAMHTPQANTLGRDSGDDARALGPGVQLGMAEGEGDMGGHLIVGHVEEYQALAAMAESTIVEVVVAGEERGSAEPVEQWEDIVVGHALVTGIDSNLPNGDPATPQCLTLALDNVLVEEVHVAGVSAPNRANVWQARSTASAIASLGMLPRHSVTISSQSFPLATCFRTCSTMIRVPAKVGFPWQTSGSITMNRPKCVFLGRIMRSPLCGFLLVLQEHPRNHYNAASFRVHDHPRNAACRWRRARETC